MMNGWDGGMTAFGWVAMGLFWIVVLAVIIWALTRLFPRGGDSQSAPQPPADEPLTILDRRLARGEIDPDTYDALRDKLRHPTPVGG